jgi:hypothetical protein
VSRSQGLAGGDAIDSDDEDDGVGGMISSLPQYCQQICIFKPLIIDSYSISIGNVGDLDAIQEGDGEENEGGTAMEQEEVVPRVDADGWETVIRGTGAKKAGKK